jgi:hypothetical protein
MRIVPPRRRLMRRHRRTIMADKLVREELSEGPTFDRKAKRPIKGGLYYLAFLLVAAILILFYAGNLI